MEESGDTTELTPKRDWIPAFLRELARTGNVSKSAKRAKVARIYVYRVRNNDPVFAQAWDEAIEVSIEFMEAEARRRAVEGYLEPQFYKGVKSGAIRKYSDTLLIFLLKAHNPKKYRDNYRVELAGDASAPVKVDHEHHVSLTTDDIRLAESLLGYETKGDRVPADGGSSQG